MIREIALDTETTGLYFDKGDRLTEIGCVEIINKEITGNTFHLFINPEREVSKGAQQVTGQTWEFLKNFPTFSQSYSKFLDFISNDILIIHNAPFDLGFLNNELVKIGAKPINTCRVLDTLPLARKKFPGSPANLNALCKRFNVDLSNREKHGALIDAELLAHVYLALTIETVQKEIFQKKVIIKRNTNTKQLLNSRPAMVQLTNEEKTKHNEIINRIKNANWLKHVNLESIN